MIGILVLTVAVFRVVGGTVVVIAVVLAVVVVGIVAITASL